MSEQPLADVIELRPTLNFLYERQRAQAVNMVAEMGVAETLITLATLARQQDDDLPVLYDEHAAIRERAWVNGVYDGLTLLGIQMDEDAG